MAPDAGDDRRPALLAQPLPAPALPERAPLAQAPLAQAPAPPAQLAQAPAAQLAQALPAQLAQEQLPTHLLTARSPPQRQLAPRSPPSKPPPPHCRAARPPPAKSLADKPLPFAAGPNRPAGPTPPPRGQRTGYPGSRRDDQRVEVLGDGAAYGHVMSIREAGDVFRGGVWTAGRPGIPMWTSDFVGTSTNGVHTGTSCPKCAGTGRSPF